LVIHENVPNSAQHGLLTGPRIRMKKCNLGQSSSTAVPFTKYM